MAAHARKVEEKVLCQTPSPGKNGVWIVRWKYDAVRKAIRKVVPVKAQGVLFQDLVELVEASMPAAQRKDLGSMPWYVTTVKLHLETLGELERVPGALPQRLRRTK